jgi:hypothetical protein
MTADRIDRPSAAFVGDENHRRDHGNGKNGSPAMTARELLDQLALLSGKFSLDAMQVVVRLSADAGTTEWAVHVGGIASVWPEGHGGVTSLLIECDQDPGHCRLLSGDEVKIR